MATVDNESANSEACENAEYGQVTETRFRTPSPPNLPPQPPSSSTSHPTSFSYHPNAAHTPAKPKASHSSKFRNAPGVEEKRQVIVKLDVPKMIPEVPVDDFFHSILPPLPRSSKGDLVEEVIAKLKENDTIKNDRWVAFEVDPREHSEKEPQAFKGLTDIWNDVISAAKKVDGSLEQTLGLVVSGHVYIHSDQSRLCQPDAFNKLYSKIPATTAQTHNDTGNARRRKSPEEYDYVYDIANPYQFKKDHGLTQIIEDFSKVVYDMEQVLARDPCRRFTFGTTIENRTTRMWFMSRAYLLRSTSFDFMTDHRRLVHLFLSLAFSSLRDLGWDTTMSFSHMDSSRRQYNIDVNGHQFTTMEVLSDASADSPLGRATRVWKVKDSAGHPRVLKDVWLETDRKEEHLIVEDILKAAGSIKIDPHIDYRGELEKRILKPMEYCRVPVYDKTVEGEPVKDEPDDTDAIMLRGYDLGSAKLVPVLPDKASIPAPPPSVTHSMAGDRDYIPSSSIRLADGLNTKSEHLESSVSSPQATLEQVDQTDATNVAQRKVVTYSAHHRYHYRVVFEQCATTIYDERNLGNVLSALLEVTKALWIMCLAGWVHRDISGGNVYWSAKAKMGLLGDFEYAVHQSEKRHHDVRTGTPFFMAAETMSNDYLYTPTATEVPLQKDVVSFTPQPKAVTPAPVISEPKLSFSYNPLHDLESIWWIIVYVIVFKDVEDESARSPDPDSRQTMMNELFHGQMEGMGRQNFFRSIKRGHIDTVQECLSSSFAPVLKLLVILASRLITAYTSSEQTHPDKIDDDCFEIHGTFTTHLERNMDSISSINLIPVKATAMKRPNPTLPEETDSERPSKRSRTSVNTQSGGSGSRTGNDSSRQTRQRGSRLRQ
ncbi:hypothetical protein F5878DRAFT_710762 [Lentinula raphanica]|uniref:Fungal-type protein kinase domain-containing protein n=1 Tax=Lentinula raphanica TaxID=153919 RepID=A0AA38P7F8_9AGAR|nr:hypothetical protein F5878DRAFT_710762 [Lentinula raphanica]